MRRVVSVCAAAIIPVLAVAACGSSSKPASAPTGSTSAPKSTAPEISPSGDIPDNQAFVKHTSPDRSYSLVVPEGWAKTTAGSETMFSSHYNSIRINASKTPTAPTATSARALGSVSTVKRSAGPVIRITYSAESAADPVTGKRVALDVERYLFWRDGTLVSLTLSAPKGSDNVDPWRKVTDSFGWHA